MRKSGKSSFITFEIYAFNVLSMEVSIVVQFRQSLETHRCIFHADAFAHMPGLFAFNIDIKQFNKRAPARVNPYNLKANIWM